MPSRRDFLVTAAGSAATVLGRGQTNKPRSSKKVIVAGGGIAGMCCAYELQRRGHEVTVLEASERVGGHVKTVRAGLPDDLYVDAGAEQFTKPGYELYWGYVREFDLPHLQDHRRERMLRWIDGRMYTEEDLAAVKNLSAFGLNQREIDFFRSRPWWQGDALYLGKFAERVTDEYQPFVPALKGFDEMSVNQLLREQGASDGYIRHFGGNGSALHKVWHTGILVKRGVPLWPTQVFRLIGGNSLLPETFAKRLGERVRLGCPVTGIRRGASGATVEFLQDGRRQRLDSDYVVCCMSAVMLRQIPVTPAWSEAKAWAIGNVPYYSATRPVFVARTKFWKEQETSINREYGQAALEHVWSMADDVTSERGLITGTAQPGVRAEKALETFRAHNPAQHNKIGRDNIEHAMVIDWSKDRWCLACETTAYRPGELRKFWPTIMEPEGRVHFAGAYCDNLNWGQEAATRSANRVARAIDGA